MKVLVVANTFPPEVQSGSGRAAAETARGFKELGHEVIALTSKQFEGLKSLKLYSDEWEGVKAYRWFPLNFYHLSNASKHNFAMRLLWTLVDIFNVVSWWQVRNLLRREKPDLIISHNIKGLGFLLPRLFVKNAKYVHVLHDVQLVEPSGLLYPQSIDEKINSLQNRVYSGLMRSLWKPVKKVVTPSQYLLNFYISLGFFTKADLLQVYNPVPDIKPIEHAGKRIIFVGAETNKGIDDVFKVWEKVKYLDCELHILGKGNRLEDAKLFTENNEKVFVHGGLSHEEYIKIFATGDVLLHPSVCIENSPTAITEAISLGIPVVATDVGGTKELVQLSVASKLVEVGDISAMTIALHNMIVNETQYQPIKFPEAKEYAEALDF
jgi:glycosyltransferase involved in cell wall biosynthesis